MKRNKCNCDLCKRDRKFERIISKLKQFEFLAKDVKWLKDLYDHLYNIELELDMLRNKGKIDKFIDPDDWINPYDLSSSDWTGFYGSIDESNDN